MGTYYLNGSEYVTSVPQEKELAVVLATLRGHEGVLRLQTGQHTVIWRGQCTIASIRRVEERIEEGHLTVDSVYFQLIPAQQPADGPWVVTLPMDHYLGIDRFGQDLIVRFEGYAWHWSPQ